MRDSKIGSWSWRRRGRGQPRGHPGADGEVGRCEGKGKIGDKEGITREEAGKGDFKGKNREL